MIMYIYLSYILANVHDTPIDLYQKTTSTTG